MSLPSHGHFRNRMWMKEQNKSWGAKKATPARTAKGGVKQTQSVLRVVSYVKPNGHNGVKKFIE